MLKKIVSNALLSMVMDKKARDKLGAIRDAKKHRNQQGGSAEKRAETAPETDRPATQENELAREFARTPPPRPRAPDGPDVVDDPAELIRQSLDAAEKELLDRQARMGRMTKGRRALIAEAMAIHRSKSHIIDDLDPEQREKLKVLAMHALDPEGKKGGR